MREAKWQLGFISHNVCKERYLISLQIIKYSMNTIITHREIIIIGCQGETVEGILFDYDMI